MYYNEIVMAKKLNKYSMISKLKNLRKKISLFSGYHEMKINESLKGVLSSYSSGELRKKENNAYLNEVIKKSILK